MAEEGFTNIDALAQQLKEHLRVSKDKKEKAKQEKKEQKEQLKLERMLSRLPPPPPPPPELPDALPPINLPLEGKYFFYPHQIQSIHFAVDRETHPVCGIKGGVLSLEMGLGKTLVAIALTALTIQQGIATTGTLYICNKTLVSVVYHDVVKFFGKRMRVVLLHHEILKDAIFQFSEETPRQNHIIVVTYDTVLKLAQAADLLPKSKFRGKDKERWAKLGRCFFSIPWFRIVADETQRIANTTSHLFHAMMKFQPGRRLCLTGTPIPNYEQDLFGQLRFCGLTTLNRIGHFTSSNYKAYHLGHTVFHRTIEEVGLDLPPKKDEKIVIRLNEIEKQLYLWFLKAANETLVAFQKKTIKGLKFTTVLKKFTWLRQLCISPHLITPESKTKLTAEDKTRLELGSILGKANIEVEQHLRDPQSPLGIHSTKLKTVVELTQKIPNEDKILVFSEWSSATRLVQQALQKAYPPESILFLDGTTQHRDQLFVEFRSNPKVRILCMTRVGAFGLTLVEANHVILLEPHWNLMHNDQASARVRRIGQTKPVTIWQIVVQGSIEEKMLEICNSKDERNEEFMKQGGISAELLQKLFDI